MQLGSLPLKSFVPSFYEMTFVLRCCHRWTAEKMPQGVRMMCLHSQRMVDDLWQIVPNDFNNFELLYFNSWEPLPLKRLTLQFTQYSPSKGKANVVAAAIRKTVNETIGEFEKSKSIVK